MHSRTAVVILALLTAVPAVAALDPATGAARLHFRGLVDPHPEQAALLILEPREGWSERDARDVETFLDRGGRVLLAGLLGSGPELMVRLGIDASVPQADLVSLDHPNGVLVRGVGPLAGFEPTTMANPVRTIVGDGTPWLTTSNYTWLDRNNNGRPDLDEARGMHPLAMAFPFGDGILLVVGSRHLATGDLHEAVSEALLSWLTEDGARPLVWHVGHQAGDPVLTLADAAAASGDAAARTLVAIGMTVVLAATVGIRFKRRPDAPRPRRALPPPRTLLESRALEELPR